MGCCFSRSSGPNSPYSGGAPSSSSRAINPAPAPAAPDPPPLNLPNAAQENPRQQQQQQQQQQPARRRRQQIPLDQKINKPLRRHIWTAKDRTWTKRELEAEREAFFHTRVTGRQEVWQTIHAALQALWTSASDAGGDSASDEFKLAQSILSAGDILLPTGDLANGVYDSFGNYYPLPECIVCDPTNVTDDANVKSEESNGADDTSAHDEDGTDVNPEEKGKGVMSVREQVTLCARLSENAQDYNVSVTTKETVRSVAKKIAEEAKVSSEKQIRIAYMGKLLKDKSTLDDQGWQTGHIVNALVFDR